MTREKELRKLKELIRLIAEGVRGKNVELVQCPDCGAHLRINGYKLEFVKHET
jgi:hypothetical protein